MSDNVGFWCVFEAWTEEIRPPCYDRCAHLIAPFNEDLLMTCFNRRLFIAMVMLVAAPAALAQDADDYLAPLTTDIKNAVAPRPDEAPRPKLTPNNSENPACRWPRMRLDRPRTMPDAGFSVHHSNQEPRSGPAAPGPFSSASSHWRARAKDWPHEGECN